MRLHFFYRTATKAAALKLIRRYGQASLETADSFVVLGGDGFMLRCLEEYGSFKKPFYGINYGTVGFLMNTIEENLLDTLKTAQKTLVHPMKVTITNEKGDQIHTHAINEVTLFRKQYRAISFRVTTGQNHTEVMGDGCIIATPLGSTAYNASAGGIRLPIEAPLLVATLINPYTHHDVKSWTIPNTQAITLDVLSPKKRPASIGIDTRTYTAAIAHVHIEHDPTRTLSLLFSDPKASRLLGEHPSSL